MTIQAAEDRLDDLLWELDRYRRGEIAVDGLRVEQVRAEALRRGRAIYGLGNSPEGLDLDLLIDARRERHDARALRRWNYPLSVPRAAAEARSLLPRYLADPGVYLRGQQLVEVRTTESEVAFLVAAGRWLRGELARLEITLEVNPSSNVVIGGLGDMTAHPLLGGEGTSAPAVSLASDDPIVFATSLVEELSHAYFGLLGRGVPADRAREWVDAAREAGWRGRFTLRASADLGVLAEVTPTAGGLR